MDEIVYMRRSPPDAPGYNTFAEKLFPNRPPRQKIAGTDLENRHLPIGDQRTSGGGIGLGPLEARPLPARGGDARLPDGAGDAGQRFDVKLLIQRILEKGKIIVKKAYADWSRYQEYKRTFHEAAIELIEIPQRKYSGKNSADIRLVVDAMDISYSKEHLDTFVIASGDSDFSPLVSKLKENDKRVIGCGVDGDQFWRLLLGFAPVALGFAALIGLSNDAPSTSHIPKAANEARLALDFATVSNRVARYSDISLRQMLITQARSAAAASSRLVRRPPDPPC